ncbi:unnamed protein product [Linum tenue]|uniref:Uncharacterized protein n=1 Tax=Linum tenue TaxID=586396 RepID=A0AAV0NYS3_9ROSI|nr:unnamed protein product [Linum tenue]
MEEDSETRRDRLKAMREAASAATDANSSGGLPTFDATPVALANPLLDRPSEMDTRGAPRFDFYTDPMAAFSATRNRNSPGDIGPPESRAPSPWPGPRNSIPTSAPPYIQGHHPVNQGMMYQPRSPYDGVASYGRQGGIRSPFPFHQGPPLQAPNPQYQGNTNYGPARSPGFNQGLGNATWMGNNPRPRSGYGGHQQVPSGGQGRGQGNFHGGNRNPGFGRNSGRGRGFHNNHGSRYTGEMRPEQFYHPSMMEDPWEGLEPIEWKGKGIDSSQSWMPRSIATKKARVSEPSIKSNTEQSLAEYLASSFNEASNADPST